MSVFWAYTLVVSIWSKLCSLLAFDKDLSFESGSHWLKSRVSWLGACWSLKILDSAVFFFKKVILFWKDFFFLYFRCVARNRTSQIELAPRRTCALYASVSTGLYGWLSYVGTLDGVTSWLSVWHPFCQVIGALVRGKVQSCCFSEMDALCFRKAKFPGWMQM